MKHTKGPWFLVNVDGNEFTAISTNPDSLNLDLANEVLGTSEWLRATPQDLVLMSAAPVLLDAAHTAVSLLRGSEFTDNNPTLQKLLYAIALAEAEWKQ